MLGKRLRSQTMQDDGAVRADRPVANCCQLFRHGYATGTAASATSVLFATLLSGTAPPQLPWTTKK